MVIYGMKVECDMPFPLQLPQEGDFRASVTLQAQPPASLQSDLTCGTCLHTTHGRRVFFYSDRPLYERFSPLQPLCYEAEGAVRFYWRYGERHIYYELLEEGTVELLAFWFCHPFFPLFLSVERYYALLHCSAVMIDGKAVVFLAPFQSGKSTLTHYMCHNGAKLLTDDILPTFESDNRVMCASSYPYSRPYRKLQPLRDQVNDFETSFQPISAIYILQNHSNINTTTITPVKGIEKFTLAKQKSLIYTFKGFRLEHEKHLGKILNNIPFFKISRPWGVEYMDDTYQSIRNHIQESIR
jgi:hypothetical protein